MNAAADTRAAGAFSPWLERTRAALRLEAVGADVPCDGCTACCRSSYFIHIRPDEARTLRRIPKALLFPAPGLPRGHVLLGYDDRGRCPMLLDGRCSIYEDRPRTCRDFDCRVFAATGIEPDADGPQAELVRRARQWRFDLRGGRDRRDHDAVRDAAAFLRERAGLLPAELLPRDAVGLAVLAIRLYDVFAGMAADAGPRPPDAEIARAVTAELERPEPDAAAGGGRAASRPARTRAGKRRR